MKPPWTSWLISCPARTPVRGALSTTEDPTGAAANTSCAPKGCGKHVDCFCSLPLQVISAELL
eukprot:1185227-Prorocentrum_minimum.AAC.1